MCLHAVTPNGASLTCQNLREIVLVGCRPIAELTIAVVTRGPHSPIGFQHHAVLIACRDRLGACVHGRWRNPIDGDHAMAIIALARGMCVCVCVCVCFGRGGDGHVDGCM